MSSGQKAKRSRKKKKQEEAPPRFRPAYLLYRATATVRVNYYIENTLDTQHCLGIFTKFGVLDAGSVPVLGEEVERRVSQQFVMEELDPVKESMENASEQGFLEVHQTVGRSLSFQNLLNLMKELFDYETEQLEKMLMWEEDDDNESITEIQRQELTEQLKNVAKFHWNKLFEGYHPPVSDLHSIEKFLMPQRHKRK